MVKLMPFLPAKSNRNAVSGGAGDNPERSATGP